MRKKKAARWTLYYVACVAMGILLGYLFVRNCQKYDDEHFAVNDDYERWSLAGWERWKELHPDTPEEEE